MLIKATADEWNEMIERLFSQQILSVTELKVGKWRHPWHVLPGWNAELERWEVDIMPGFVNWLDAVVQIESKYMPIATKERLRRRNVELVEKVDAWLTEGPQIPILNMRPIGSDATPTNSASKPDGGVTISYEKVPAFFLELGVAPPPETTVDGDTLQISQQGVLGEDKPTRLLRAAELVLYQDREVAVLEPVVGAPQFGTVIDYQVIYARLPDARERAYINQPSRYVATPLELALLQPRAEKHLSTLYFVSPPNAPMDEPPNGSWQAYVQHHVFFDLSYRVKLPERQGPSQVLTLPTGLAGGVADALNNSLLQPGNDSANAMLLALRNVLIEGRWWTV